MTSVALRIVQRYNVRREVSQPADLASLLLARLVYNPPYRRTRPIIELESRLKTSNLIGVQGRRAKEFTHWLYKYLVINDTVRGVSFYPVHPALSLSTNNESGRVDSFIRSLASMFTLSERQSLINRVWAVEDMPAFERMIFDIISWQVAKEEIAPPASLSQFRPDNISATLNYATRLTGEAILEQTKEDLLALSRIAIGVQAFISHSGRLLALALSRYLLAQAGVNLDIPIYAAPAADTHDGVKTLAHEIIEIHRDRFARALERQFRHSVDEAMTELGWVDDPSDEVQACALVSKIFDPRATIIRKGTYSDLRANYGSFTNIAYDYYWTQGSNRFLRQLHATHLNMAKKAGFANSRSRYSQWHFYWLAPTLVETLLLIAQARTKEPRILLVNLLDDWYSRYGLAVQINHHWRDAYQRDFRSMGSPEAINEANERRFMEILAERGRLHKNSDDFPWVILRD